MSKKKDLYRKARHCKVPLSPQKAREAKIRDFVSQLVHLEILIESNVKAHASDIKYNSEN